MKVFTAAVLLGLVACAYCAEIAQDIQDSQMDIDEDSQLREKRFAPHYNGFGFSGGKFGGFNGGKFGGFRGGKFGGFRGGRFGNFGFRNRGNFGGFRRGGSKFFGGRFFG